MATEGNNDKLANAGTAPTPNYGKSSFKEKFFRKLRSEFVTKINNTFFQFRAYPCYWHYLVTKGNRYKNNNKEKFITQKPDYGAGIGHQLANWNSGLFFSQLFGLQFAHTPFSSKKWEVFLGFGELEVLAQDLIDSSQIKKVRLPIFDAENPNEVQLIKNIIDSYSDKKILFLLEINQGYTNQFETATLLSTKFFEAPERKNDQLIFDKQCLNIAIHIRRRMSIEDDTNWKMRGLDNAYFSKILKSVLSNVSTTKRIEIYLFSQGVISEFPEFSEFKNLHYCMDMNPYDSFLHMVKADLLISSKSSFSYKPALISKGIKICPTTFWHFYPSSNDFILADNDSNFDVEQLKNQLNILK